MGTSLAYLPREAGNSSLIEVCNHAPGILPKMRNLKLLTLIWCSFSRWGRERVTSAFSNEGGQYLSYDYLQPMATLITQDARPKIVDAPLTLRWHSFPGWGRERLSTYFGHKGGQYIQKEQWHMIINILRLILRYQNPTTNRTIRNATPEIGPDGASETRRNPWVDGYGARFRPSRSSRSGFWTGLEPNQSVFPV